MTANIQRVFGDEPSLLKRINAASATHPELSKLFIEMAVHVELKAIAEKTLVGPVHSEPVAKKRKIETSASKSQPWQPTATFHEISFTIPQRKKLKLEISTQSSGGVRIVHPSGDTEATALWSSIDSIACVPVPEKAQPQYNVCIFYKSPTQEDQQILFTIPAAAPKPGTVDLASGTPNASTTYKDILLPLLNARVRVSEPSAQEFSSSLPQALRKGEKAYHIKAFKGAKEGYLFLLSSGILYGFKKPLEYYLFSVIDSVSYTSVLQRTFNLNINVRDKDAGDGEGREVEFGMLDQADFAGIDEYIKKHGLQDASMAEERRAKKLNVNGVKGEEDGAEDGEGELEKAAREAGDEDDEEEDDENFDPGSEGESEGEGSDTDDDDEEMEDGQRNGDDDDDDDDDE